MLVYQRVLLLNPKKGPLATNLASNTCPKSGQGPPGRVLAVRQISPLRRREGLRPLPPTSPPRQKPPRFTVFCALPNFSHFSDLVAQDGSTWANIGLKMGQHSPQDGPTWPPRWAKIAPRWANIAPRSANIAPKMGQDSPKMDQHSPKIGPHSPKIGQHSPKIGRRPSKYPAFYSVFLLFPFFGSFGSTCFRPT